MFKMLEPFKYNGEKDKVTVIKATREEEFVKIQLKRKREEGNNSLLPKSFIQNYSKKMKVEPIDGINPLRIEDSLQDIGERIREPVEFLNIKQKTIKQETNMEQMLLDEIKKEVKNEIIIEENGDEPQIKVENSVPEENSLKPTLPKRNLIKIIKVAPQKTNIFKMVMPNIIEIPIPQNKNSIPKIENAETKTSIPNQMKPMDKVSEPPYNAKEDQAIFALSSFVNKTYMNADHLLFFTVLKEVKLGNKNVAKIISDHIVGRGVDSIKERFVNVISKNKFLYARPTLLFEIVLEYKGDNGVKGVAKMITIFTQYQMLILKCKTPNGQSCIGHHPDISIKLKHDSKKVFGIDESLLYDFLLKNVPKDLKMPTDLENFKSLLTRSGVSFHTNSCCHIHNTLFLGSEKSNKLYSVNVDSSLQNEASMSIENNKDDKGKTLYFNDKNQLMLSLNQVKTLKTIVHSVGKDRCWKTIYELLCLSFSLPKPSWDSQVQPWHAVDRPHDDLIKNLKKSYLMELDPDLFMGAFTPLEDEQLGMLSKCWRLIPWNPCEKWKMIARHMQGRTVSQLEERASTLGIKEHHLAPYTNDRLLHASICFDLMITPKNDPEKYIRQSVSHPSCIYFLDEFSVNCLVVGTRSEIFVYLCEEPAQWCDHSKFVSKSFIYDPDKSDDQFANYLKLTVWNELVKEKLVEKSFDYTNLQYKGDGIHALMETQFNAMPSIFMQLYIKYRNASQQIQKYNIRLLVLYLMDNHKTTSKFILTNFVKLTGWRTKCLPPNTRVNGKD